MIETTPTERAAANIRAELARQRMHQAQIAEALGVTQANISRRLTGATPIDVNELTAIAGILGVPVTRLLEDAAA